MCGYYRLPGESTLEEDKKEKKDKKTKGEKSEEVGCSAKYWNWDPLYAVNVDDVAHVHFYRHLSKKLRG